MTFLDDPQGQPLPSPGWSTSPYAPPYTPTAAAQAPAYTPPHPPAPWPSDGTPWAARPGPYGPPPGGVAPSKSSTHPVAVAALALGCAAIAVLGVAAGLVSVPAGLAGIVAGVVALRMSRRAATRGRGLAVAGVTTSSVAVVMAGAVLAVTTTGIGANLAAWASDDVDLPVVALRPGEQGVVGDYRVTVDEIRMDADAALTARGANPRAEGRYVEAVVTVTYQGRDVGLVADDLLVSYVGSDDRWIYDEWGCAATTENPSFEVADLAPGDTATFVACMDVPDDVLGEAAVIVEDLWAQEFSAEMWGAR